MLLLSKESKKKLCLMQAITLFLSVIFMALSSATSSISANAIGKIDDKKTYDFTAYTFDELCDMGMQFPSTASDLSGGEQGNNGQVHSAGGNGAAGDIENDETNIQAVKNALYYNLKSAQEYAKWYNKAVKVINNDGNGNFQPEPFNGYLDLSEQKQTEAWAEYEVVANQMTMIMARGASEKMVGSVFGNNFDPTNAVTIAAMRTFTMVCNATFNVIAKALMLLFLVQTGFDVLYLVIPALQPILAPANASSGGGNAGLAQGKKFALRFNVVSNEAVEANNRGATGSVGSNGGTGGGFLQTNIAMRYLIARAPLIIIAFTYFVLVATNVWTDIITWTTSLITGFFYGL